MNDEEILFGFSSIGGIGDAIFEALVEKNDYQSIWDFMRRSDPILMNKRVIENLLESGTFDELVNDLPERPIRRSERIEILGFVDHTLTPDWTYESGARTINLLTKGSLRHLTLQLKKTIDEHISDIEKISIPIVFGGVSYRFWTNEYPNLNALKTVLQHLDSRDNCLLAVRNDGTKDWLERILTKRFDFFEFPDPGLFSLDKLSKNHKKSGTRIS